MHDGRASRKPSLDADCSGKPRIPCSRWLSLTCQSPASTPHFCFRLSFGIVKGLQTCQMFRASEISCHAVELSFNSP
jgi:hypothetical protein